MKAPDSEVMVLHTLTADPDCGGRGCGRAFVAFYEDCARSTNAINVRARAIYRRLGCREADIVDCTFNGIPGVRLVCLEKELTPAQ